MKMPKRFRTYCPYCKKHSTHEIERVKGGKASSLTKIVRQRKRHTGIGNSGKFSKVPGGDKPTKKINVRYRCAECKKAHTRKGFRISKLDLVE